MERIQTASKIWQKETLPHALHSLDSVLQKDGYHLALRHTRMIFLARGTYYIYNGLRAEATHIIPQPNFLCE